MLDLLLVMALGFLGSFGHCAGMCGPIAVAFSLSQPQNKTANWWHLFYFHGLLNLGRLCSYALVGAGIGAVGSVLLAGGSLAGMGSSLRQAFAIITGLMLIWFGLVQIKPNLLPSLPFLHPLLQANWHQRLSRGMMNLSMNANRLTPALLGLVWGLIPCGFLYAAQLKAAETGSIWQGAATMLAFGLGTFPMMLGVGVSASKLSADRRSQLYRLGGWLTLGIGCLTLLRTDAMVDYTGHGALLCLMLALVARPVSRLWGALLQYRRVLGVGAFVLALAHTGHMLDHSLRWNLDAIAFLLPLHQWGILAGAVSLALMTPAAITSFDYAQKRLGSRWRQLHLLSIPALLLGVTHALLIGSHYLGHLEWSRATYGRVAIALFLTLAVLCLRWRWIWALFHLEKFYTPASPQKTA